MALCASTAAAQAVINKITQIRQAVEAINHHADYRIKQLDNGQFLDHTPDGGGQLTGYFKDGQLIKIVEWIGLSSCINTTEYYLQDGRLFFAYTQGKVFNYEEKSQSFNPAVQSVAMEVRFYFLEGKLFKSVLKGETICSGKPLAGWARHYQTACEKYSKLLSQKQ